MEIRKFIPKAITVFSLLVTAACATINKGDNVYIEGAALGSNPYSESVIKPEDWKCQVPAGSYTVLAIDLDFDIININNCWIKRKNVNLSTKPPKPTVTPFPTQDPFIPLPISTPQK